MAAVTRTADSVYVRDSVYVLVTQERTEVTRWRTVWRDRTVHDTIRIHTTDTIVRTETVERVADPTQPPLKRGSTGWAVAAALFLLMAVYIAIKTLSKTH